MATQVRSSQGPTVELLEERLNELEARVFGPDATRVQQQQQKQGQTATVQQRISDLTAKLALYTTGRRNINRIYSQLQQLEQTLQMSMRAPGTSKSADDLRAQCEVMLLEEQQIQSAAENLKKIAQLQTVLDSKPISNTLDYADRLNKISAKQHEQTARLDQLVAKTHAVVIAYNTMIGELGSWADVWCQNDA